jgi:hypothetical protein
MVQSSETYGSQAVHLGAAQPAHGSTGWPQSQSSGSGSMWVMTQSSMRHVSVVLRAGEVWVTSPHGPPGPKSTHGTRSWLQTVFGGGVVVEMR